MHLSISICILSVICLCSLALHPSHAFISLHVRATRKALSFQPQSSTFRLLSSENNVDESEPVAVDEKSVVEQQQSNQAPPEPSPDQIMAAMGTSPRRILLSVASASGIALAANFLGITSRLLESVPESAVEASGLDTYYPRGMTIVS